MAVRQDVFRRNVMTIPAGSGSGFVWDDQGHIVTNYHVIREADAARVTLADQSSYDAKLVGHAIDKDLAVLEISVPPAKLQPLERGTSENLAVGQQALAIGNPFGLDHTLSVGVVSGLGREIKSLADRPIFGVIQTDAAINPGNSGGPLLDSSGKLIGVNTAIYSPSGASAGIGFAVPVDTVELIVPQLIKHGKVVRPGLGIQFDPAIQSRIGVKGVLVLGVMPDSPAEKAGIRATSRNSLTGAIVLGDIIVAIDGNKVEHQNDLFKALDDKAVGDTVKVTVKRGDQTRELAVTLASMGAR
jgi:S1-C subfamily serine protease